MTLTCHFVCSVLLRRLCHVRHKSTEYVLHFLCNLSCHHFHRWMMGGECQSLCSSRSICTGEIALDILSAAACTHVDNVTAFITTAHCQIMGLLTGFNCNLWLMANALHCLNFDDMYLYCSWSLVCSPDFRCHQIPTILLARKYRQTLLEGQNLFYLDFFDFTYLHARHRQS